MVFPIVGSYASWSVVVVCLQWARYSKYWKCVRSKRSCNRLVSRSIRQQLMTSQPASHLPVSRHSTSTARHRRSLSDAGQCLLHRYSYPVIQLSASTLAPLQRAQNVAVRLALGLDRRSHIIKSATEATLAAGQVAYRVIFKIATIMHQTFHRLCRRTSLT